MNPRTIVDAALELSVVGSFSRHGFLLRRRLFGWVDPPAEALRHRTVLVTGPTSGLGRVVAGELAALGARVLLAGRSAERLARVRDELVAAHGEDRFPLLEVDMASLPSVRAAVERVLATEPRLDVLVDNAGAIFPERRESPDGIEATLATMVVGPFVLIGGLLPLLRRTGGAPAEGERVGGAAAGGAWTGGTAAGGARVIAVASGGMYAQAVRLGDLEWRTEPFSGTRAYARAKRVQIALVREWARRVGSPDRAGVRFNAMHPGWADTPGLVASLPSFYRVMRPHLRTPAQGADTIVWLATDPEAGAAGGQLFLDRRPRPFDRTPATRLSAADRRRLWDLVVGLSGGPDPVARA